MGKKKMKGVAVESSDVKARQRRDDLMQDFQELQKEADAMRHRLEVAKHRRLLLAAEVRFLRRRHKHLMKAKVTNYSRQCIDMGPTFKQAKNTEGILIRKGASQHRLPPLPDSRPSKRRCTGKKAVLSGTSPTTILAKELFGGEKECIRYSGVGSGPDSDHKQRLQALTSIFSPILDKESGVNGIGLRHSIGDFDLKQCNNSSRQKASFPNRAPTTFDLNEVLTGEEDLEGNNLEVVKFEEARKSSLIGVDDDQHNDLKLLVCRNAGEGSTHMGKPKISWQDPLVLRV